MARQRRCDTRGSLYHVMNRGSARRTIFDTRDDFRFFLSCVARAVRRGEIEVCSYVLMRTHFHLLVRSRGGLSTAMQRIQLRHVRRFNRTRGRDGPLLRGRFRAKRVNTWSYERNVIRYIHENPVLARICEQTTDYPWSSAWLVRQPRTRRWFDSKIIGAHGPLEASSRKVMSARADLMRRRLLCEAEEADEPVDWTTPARVVDWMRRKAALADGTNMEPPHVGAEAVMTQLDTASIIPKDSTVRLTARGSYRSADLIAVGLLRDAACCTVKEVSQRTGFSPSRVRRLARAHARAIAESESYGELAARVLRRAVGVTEQN